MDLRALALFRIGLGLTVLVDLVTRAPFLMHHYTDAGAIPRSLVLKSVQVPRISLYQMVGETELVMVLYAIQILAALALLVGFKTRIANIVTWVLLVSLHSRAPVLLNAGDMLIRLMLFWAIFLPVGRIWSWDARGKPPSRATAVLNMFTAALTFQTIIVYITTEMFKTGPSWWDGRAVHRVFQLDLYMTPMGHMVKDWDWAHAPMTWFVVVYWILGPILVLLPVWTKPARAFGIAVFVFIHFSFGFFLNLGMFPMISCVTWFPLIPSFVFDKAELRLGRIGAAKPVVWAPPIHRGWTVLGGSLLVYVALWNARTVYRPTSKIFPFALNNVGYVLALDQKWDMFAPAPTGIDGWYIFEGRTESGESVNLFQWDEPVPHEKPDYVLGTLKSRRWGKMFVRLRGNDYKSYRKPLMSFLIRHFNDNHPELQVVEAKWTFMQEPRTSKAHKTDKITKKVLWQGAAP